MKRLLKEILFKIYYPLRNRLWATLILPINKIRYVEYHSTSFKKRIKDIGICLGDSIFVMCSPDKVFKATGHRLPVHLVLNDLLEVIGEDGTIMALCYSRDRDEIFDGKLIFNVKKTPTQCGMFSELLRRREGSVRSLQPMYSVIAFGKKAKDYCSLHNKSPYAYDNDSPCHKITVDGGKYLGIGLGVEAFSPAHMIDDFFKDKYIHKINTEIVPRKLKTVDIHGKEQYVYCYKRKLIKGLEAPKHHFKLLNIDSKYNTGKDGIFLFSMNMDEYYKSGIKLFENRKITIWNQGLPPFFSEAGYRLTQAKKLLWG